MDAIWIRNMTLIICNANPNFLRVNAKYFFV